MPCPALQEPPTELANAIGWFPAGLEPVNESFWRNAENSGS